MEAFRSRRVWASGLSTLLLFLGACTSPKDEWTEQVALDGGEVVTVHTRLESDVRSPVGDASQRFTAEARLKILGQIPDAPEWVDSRDPILLMRDPTTKDFVLIASSGDSRVWERHGRPMNPYWMFRLRDGAWTEEPIADFVFGRDTNLVLTLGPAGQKKGVVTLEEKRQWNAKANLGRRYRRVERHYQFGRD